MKIEGRPRSKEARKILLFGIFLLGVLGLLGCAEDASSHVIRQTATVLDRTAEKTSFTPVEGITTQMFDRAASNIFEMEISTKGSAKYTPWCTSSLLNDSVDGDPDSAYFLTSAHCLKNISTEEDLYFFNPYTGWEIKEQAGYFDLLKDNISGIGLIRVPADSTSDLAGLPVYDGDPDPGDFMLIAGYPRSGEPFLITSYGQVSGVPSLHGIGYVNLITFNQPISGGHSESPALFPVNNELGIRGVVYGQYGDMDPDTGMSLIALSEIYNIGEMVGREN